MAMTGAAFIMVAGLMIAAEVHAQETEQPEVVTLTYNWPTDLKGTVVVHLTKSQQSQGQAVEETMTVEAKFWTLANDDGLTVFTENQSFELSRSNQAEGVQALLQESLDEIAAISPNYKIDANGELLGVVGIDALHATIMRWFDRLLESVAELGTELPEQNIAQIRQLVERLSAPEVLQANIQAEWNRDVSQWQGASLEKDAVYRLDADVSTPMLGDAPIPAVNEYVYHGRVACNDADTALGCVKLTMTSRLHPEKAGDAIRQLLAPLGEAAPIISTLQIDTDVSLITEPNTLIPHRMQQEKHVRLVISKGEDGEEVTEQVENRTDIYRY